MDIDTQARLQPSATAALPATGIAPGPPRPAPAPHSRPSLAQLVARVLPKPLKRRLGRALARAPKPTPLQQLAEQLRAQRAHGARTLALCIELGLVTRARQALASMAPSEVREAARIRLALLCGDTELALARAHGLLKADQAPDCTPQELAEIVDALAPVSPRASLDLLRGRGLSHPAEPALLLALGYPAAAERRATVLGHLLGADRWLLQSNLQHGVQAGAGLNRYLQAHGLAPLALADGQAAPGLNNLRRQATTAPATSSAALLSVVMTAYQSETHVQAAMRSVLDGDHRPLELLVIDDGSTDATWQRVCEVAATDARVRPLRLRRNVGTYAAKNVGLALAAGEYVAFQDSDDWSHPERFSRCLSAFQAEPSRLAVSAHYVRLADDGTFHAPRVWPLTRWTPNSIVFRRHPVLQRIGFFDEHRFGADSEYLARLVAAFGRQAHLKLPQPLLIAAHRPQSLMTSASTGVDARGQSRVRSDYQEAWTEALLQHTLRGVDFYRDAVVGLPALTSSAAGTDAPLGPAREQQPALQFA